MRRHLLVLLLLCLASTTGCAVTDFWALVADSINSGKGYHSDHSTNRYLDYSERFAQQEAAAREYYQDR